MNLVPVGELKPLDFFRIEGTRAMKLDNVWYVYRTNGTYKVSQHSPNWEVDPMPPNCDSFDWQPPREPTALELAKKLAETLHTPTTWTWESVQAHLALIIAAMELEAKK